MNGMNPMMLVSMLNGLGIPTPAQSIGAALGGGPQMPPPQMLPVTKPAPQSRQTAQLNPSLGQVVNNFGTGPVGGY